MMNTKSLMQKIHLFLIPIDLKSSPPFWPLYEEDESRMNRFRKESDKKVMIQSRFALRTILGELLGYSPLSLQFCKEEAGKPKLINSDLHFSLSHTHGWQAICVSLDQEVGVDIENLLREDVIGSFLAPDSSNSRSKIELWCAKEAIVKRFGIGWSIPPSYVKISPDRTLALLQGQKSRLSSMTLFDHHHVALAFEKMAKIQIHYIKHWSELLEPQFSFKQKATLH